MFGRLGAQEILFILVLGLLIFGSAKLPEVGRSIGKALGEFRNAVRDAGGDAKATDLPKEKVDTEAKQ